MKYSIEFFQRFSKTTVFSARDARLFLQSKGASGQYVRLFLHNLVAVGKLHRITKGAYSFHEEMQAVGMAYAPYYYGLQDALSLHGFWEQKTNPVVITPRKIRPGVRTFLGNNYLVRRIDRRMFFGFHTIKYCDFWVNVSDPEKTLIDFAYFKAPLSNDALEEIREKIDKKKLKQYLGRVPLQARRRVERMLAKK
ncbi:MAG: type IV toxin-antitoxin system AbiEi family antitoxin [Candidatus Micrarchaeia archaeon]